MERETEMERERERERQHPEAKLHLCPLEPASSLPRHRQDESRLVLQLLTFTSSFTSHSQSLNPRTGDKG